jgi:hypothetical protein
MPNVTLPKSKRLWFSVTIVIVSLYYLDRAITVGMENLAIAITSLVLGAAVGYLYNETKRPSA